MNVVDPVIEEIHEARRKLWDESDGTMAGYSRHCEEVAREFRARVAAEVARKQAQKKRTPPRRRKPEFADATAVREDAPGYGAGVRTTGTGPRAPSGETSDLARETGAEGE